MVGNERKIMNNIVIHGEATHELKKFGNETVDLTVFSPPYDGLRDYNGFECDLHELGEQILRVTKDGGIAAMVIQDQTIDGAKSLTTFRTAVDWCDNIGWRMFETCIYLKNGKDGAWWRRRFRVDHEYILLFVKGRKPRIFDKEPVKIPTKHGGKTMTGGANRNKDGKTVQSKSMVINPTKCPGTVWDFANGGDKVPMKREHPAVYPDRIPYNIIQVFSKKGDLVLDPMVGSGSTGVAAKALNRNFVGIDISEEYCTLAKKRISTMTTNLPAAG